MKAAARFLPIGAPKELSRPPSTKTGQVRRASDLACGPRVFSSGGNSVTLPKTNRSHKTSGAALQYSCVVHRNRRTIPPPHSCRPMGFFRKSSHPNAANNAARNPQSGQGECSQSSSSGGALTAGSQESDANVPTVNLTHATLTERRLQDWRAVSGTNVPGGVGVGGVGAGIGVPAPGAASNTGGSGGGTNKTTSPRSSYAASPNQLILLIERGRWAEAAQRAVSHEHEVRQLVKLRKTTKHRGGGGGRGGEGGDGTGADGASGGGSGGSGGGGGRRSNVQISNVKCKALHHACQKLRSVHTAIYQKPVELHTNGSSGNDSNTNSSNGNHRRIIEDDEYVEACKCILALIRIHPEACKERESRHGCLPLHLCVFSMCATPPPPPPSSSSRGGRGNDTGELGRGMSMGRPPVPPPSSLSMVRPPTSPASPRGDLNLPKAGGGGGQHRKVNSEDFSLGNISELIREESEHQAALTEHKAQERRRKDSAESNQGGGGGGEGSEAHDTLEDRLLGGINDMERWLSGLESRYGAEEGKAHEERRREGPSLDPLEERSRETDSHSTPRVGGGGGSSKGGSGSGSGSGNGGGKGRRDARTGAASGAEELANLSMDEKPSAAAALDAAGNAPSSANDTTPTTTAMLPPPTSATPTYDELQRRYLQLNPRRRDEYAVRVLNALLDAWPKSIKTSSEGGRLPLHMACFGKATVKVMETVLRAYPDAARQRNHDGFLPIHIAAHWGVSHPDVAPLLLRAYPDGAVGRNRWERTPIEEALGMAGENGREHQLSLVWSLRRHPTYWIHNDIGTMLLPRNVRSAPWRLVDGGDAPDEGTGNGGGAVSGASDRRVNGGGGAVDVDEVGSSDEDEGVEVQMAAPASSTTRHDPAHARTLADATDLSLLITRDRNWDAAALRCRRHPREAREAMEVKVRGAYTAKITPLHYACENRPSVDAVRALVEAYPPALERRQEPGGQLPLHAACTWGASPEVVRTLLKANPDCAGMRDFLSNLPLHCACYSGAATVVVEALLRAYPQGVWPRNHQGSSAADIVRRLGHPNRREVLALLEGTMARLLARAGSDEGVEIDQHNSLEWV